jgi:ectoine hydroxylase-related dioxygenase (phytanoyl-CoA dioxygenase family)
MLDDFTPENGATWLMHRGHEWPHKPTDEEFDDYKFQIIGKAGTMFVWNSNLWHRAGENKTDKPRRSVTPEFSKPFMKQGFDYPKVLPVPKSAYLRQVLGFNALVPASLNDWYQPRESRLYKDDQE